VTSALGAIATVLAVCFLLPQLARLRRTRDALGVSATTAAVGLVTTVAWVAYGVATTSWAVTVPSAIGALQYLVLLAYIQRSGRPIVASVGWGLLWALVLLNAGAGSAASGRGALAGLGAALAASAVIQYAPAVREAYRSKATTGISRSTWLLVGANGVTWMLYGALADDLPVACHGIVLVVAATAVAASTLQPWRSPERGTRTRTSAF
jgi:uncharacterized protein with PQ loop repeat